ncbi:cilia- and flagella-associated protein 47-like isoform X4 [Mercenaria mercenaria]|uniref:cilia- and flagella-associated protein 47-like isoform X4 n=1 Tax=Mercenaria mercenaria TaxID=6596 RepID=UPI00234EB73B|nr:cilia- and flagella-associated protein 47-like isoform X4 [Mercenaria mercenaria]
MDKDVAGIRISPASVDFYDTVPDTVEQLNVTVYNISKGSKSIRFYAPKTKKFKLKVKNPDKPVASGLSVPAIVEYTSTEEGEFKDRIVVTVDGEVVEIPIAAYPTKPKLEVDQSVDFGNVVANSKTIAREISLVNHGSKAGEFKIKYAGNQPIAIMPTSGSVPPKSVQLIKVEFVTKYPGKIEEIVKVKLEDKESKLLTVRANLVEQALQVLSLETQDPINCIPFGHTYYGSDRTECALLFNNGPEPINFVAILDEDAVAQEMGIDLTRNTMKALAEQGDTSKVQGDTNELTSLVTAIPNQGILQPYEKIPVFFRFSPRWNSAKSGFKNKIAPPPRKDFALFMKLQIIGSKEGFENSGDKVVEVALTGTALPVLLDISPASKYDFGEVPVGEHADILCTLKNSSDVLPITYQFRRIAHFIAHPPNGKIQPLDTQDVIFSFAPNQAGFFKPQQMIDVIGHVADNRNPTLAHLQIIHTLPIHFLGRSDPITKYRNPKYNAGLTPYISNEVGMFVDTTFSSLGDEPRNAVAGGRTAKLHNKLAKSTAEEDWSTKVAFPNDRAHSIRPSDRKDEYNYDDFVWPDHLRMSQLRCPCCLVTLLNKYKKSSDKITAVPSHGTIFTRTKRHTYIDPDYAHIDDDDVKKWRHRDSYVQLIREMKERRMNKKKRREFKETNTSTDIGIKPAAGISPKKLLLEEIKPDPKVSDMISDAPPPPNQDFKLLSSKSLSATMKSVTSQPVKDGLNAVPTTPKEKIDCSKFLTPQEQHQVVIGPAVLDFGSVCLRSISTKHLEIVNNLDQNVLVVAEIDCRELRQSSPLSQVVPPKSKANIPIIFESNQKQKFQRSVSYTVNNYHKHHVTVLAEVVPVALQLSTDELVLKPSFGLPSDAGFRGIITLYNKLNYPAEFTWAPNLGEKGTAFSIRPATGVVDPFKDLDCEVVWHPSFLAPEDGSFSLMIHSGSTLQLKCKAELGQTNVQFVERRIMFGQVPVNLCTTRNVLLANIGHNHAYFQVNDPNPFPGLQVSPLHGVVPVGGHAELQVKLTPDAILKFDTRVQVAIKGGKNLELRMGGTVEPPTVDIDLPSFNFGGVYCGSGSTLTFKLTNRMLTKAKLEFDLSRYKDFNLNFPGYQTQEDYTFQVLNPGMFSITLQPEETVEGELIFMPTEVAAYDFELPTIINHTGAPSPAPTPFPPTPAPSNKNSLQHIINPKPQPYTVITPRKHVIATALRQPLQLSTNKIEMFAPASFYDTSVQSGQMQSKGTIFVNNSDNDIKWGIDLRSNNPAITEGFFKFIHPSGAPFTNPTGEETKGIEGDLKPGETQHVAVMFCPKEPGRYEVLLPVILNDNYEKPYQYLQVVAELKAPKLWFDPLAIVLTPVPLLTEVSSEFTMFAAQFRNQTKIIVETPEVECEDGTKISPLKVTFPESQEVKPCCGDEGQIEPFSLPCKVTFASPKPVSFAENIIFTFEGCKKPFKLMVTATADNCLLTCYPFLALHRTDHQIVCEQGSTPKGQKTVSKESLDHLGEAVFIPCQTPNQTSRPSTSATSSNFQVSSSSYESSESTTDSTDGSTPINRDGAKNKPPSGSDHQVLSRQNDLASRSLGSAMFPDEDSEEGIFHMEVLLAVQRWFSAQGWPGGPFPITIPHSLRIGISRKPVEEEKGAKAGSWDTNNLKKEFKTIYDMISNLAGRSVPGIPLNGHLPSDPIERVKQVFWQHSTLLTFLKCQGACVASVKPEYLMDPRDYHLWKQIQAEFRLELERKGNFEQAAQFPIEEELEDDVFEAVSKRAWTDILLQILKTLVLAKVTPRTLKNTPSPDKNISMPEINPDPFSSNIYNMGERIILAWLNHHYEHYRQKVWLNCEKGGIPPARWIVNYDFDLLDGLVLGAVLGAHMPFLIKTHLEDMYTRPATAEQCLHNALKVTNAMRYAGIDYDIQAIDITDPNPIALLLLCANLYQRLPQYLPKATVEFSGPLHNTVSRQVKLSNPSGKPLVYQVLLAGHDARDFRVPKGDFVSIPPKSTLPLSVEFTSRFLRPSEAILVLVGRRQGSAVGSTLTFSLCTQVENIAPKKFKDPEKVIKCESPCYELEKINLDVTNPFSEAGEFRIVLVEASGALLDPGKSAAILKRKEKKRKRIRSKIDSGIVRPETPPSPPPKISDTLQMQKEDDENMMSAFYSPVSSVYLDAYSSTTVEIHFLPFNVGERQCSVIFLNEEVGEFLYSIEAKSTMPLPDVVPFVKTTHSVRISSAAAAGTGKGLFGGDERVVYWKCEAGQELQEYLTVPFTNQAREKALLLASQQRMTDVEFTRRVATGTLHCSNVAAQTITKLSSDPQTAIKKAKERGPRGQTYKVEVDSSHFKLPDKLFIPPSGERSQSAPTGKNVYIASPNRHGKIEIPVKFYAEDPGHYPVEIILRGTDDVRVFRIECTVNPEGSTAEINFTSPVHQNVTQEIPLVNMTNHDWPLQAHITGNGFHGPSSILAKAYQTSKYPLVFRPQNENPVTGKLVLTNREDGTEHVFHLSGTAEKPLALEHVVLKSQVKKTLTYDLKIPNVTRKKLCYKVESDLSIVSGNQSISVLPGQQTMYKMTVAPVRRGVFKGVIAFVAGKNPVVEVDSDGDEMPDEDEETRQFYGYRVWYSLEIHVKPSPPERVLEVTCSCQKKQLLEVIVRNPTQHEVTLEATIAGRDLSGAPSITLPAGSKDVYTLQYAPAVIGQTKGSLIFYHEMVGEFWYLLKLMAESPTQTTLPHMQCELGRWTKQNILLDNPTDETLELIPSVSNTNNFSLERDNERPIILAPNSRLEIPLHFMPSALGEGDHLSKICFLSEQLGEWVFVASGTGLLPQTQDPVSVFTVAGSNTTLIIPFRNPMDQAVLCEVMLRDKNSTLEETLEGSPSEENSPFCLLLKRKGGIRVGPKSTLDIPVCFAPTEMKMYEAICTVIVTREDGEKWQYAPRDTQGYQLSRTGSEGVSEVRWVFPIQGIPESRPIKESYGAVIECKARDRLEERLEVTLAGVAPVTSGPQRSIYTRSITPKNESPKLPDGIVVGETLAVAEEFTYELSYKDPETKENLQNSVALKLVRQHRDTASGLVVLVFNVIFNPFRTMDYGVTLEVKASQGGVWKFPIRFLALEPPVDDLIDIEATGLGKESSVGFRLTSQTKYPLQYNAYFSAGSDPEFTISPATGELLPLGSNGTLVRVGFCPSVYGKIYTGKLIIQTPDMQWSYNVRGVLPDYAPPRGVSSHPMRGPHPDPRMRGQRVNYILDNIRLKTTAVSSPIKGAPVLQRLKIS